ADGAPRGGRGSGTACSRDRRRRTAEAEAQACRQEDDDRKEASREKESERQVMGQKVHPGGMRVGVIHDWKSNWYTGKKEFPGYLIEDSKIREHIDGKRAHAGLSDLLTRKDQQRITVDIYPARPGSVTGRSGVEADA